MSPIAAQINNTERLQAIIGLIEQCGETIPDIAAKVSKAALQNKTKRRALTAQPNPADYQVIPGFLLFDDGSKATQLRDIDTRKAGYVLMRAEDAAPWLQTAELMS